MSWVAVDGEAEAGAYSILCDSEGRSIYKRGGLSSRECFDFLLDAGDRRLACFGLNYDANQWLCSLSRDDLDFLWKYKSIIWQTGSSAYRIEWIPGKEITISKCRGETERKISIVESWGFFQTSFVKACEAWQLEVPSEIEEMKSKRGTFTKEQRQRVTNYCLTECQMLAELMDKLQTQCEQQNIVPRKWIGSGQLGAALLERQGIEEHHCHDEELEALEPIRRAYFGGRVEMFAQGVFQNVTSYDINSAYPAGAMSLPSLRNSKLLHTTKYVPGIEDAIWRVKWRTDPNRLVTPFPVRIKNNIYYPFEGEGCYHAIELRAAINASFTIEILEGWILDGHDPGLRPFSFIPEVYQYRKDLKEKGDAGEKVVKLALNSMYGKLAQGQGYRNSSPRWQSYFWAGKITAWTRAMIMSLISQKPPLMVSTDGVFFEGDILNPPTQSPDLGDWERGSLENLFVVQPGVYWAHDGWFNTILRSRGFFVKDIDYGELRDAFLQDGSRAVYEYDSHRFIGAGVALHRKDFSQWLTWRDEVRQISCKPTRRIPIEQDTLEHGPYLLPPGAKDLGHACFSEAYIPKGKTTKLPIDHLQGLDQPRIEE